jgi:hypothetical protein
MAEDRLEKWLRPRNVFAALALLLVLAVVFSPGEAERVTSALSTYTGQEWGARGVYEVLQKLGFRVEQRITPLRAPLDSAVVYAVLDPPMEPSAREVSAILNAVRRGAGLIVTPDEGSVLAESLHVERSEWVARSLMPMSDSLFGERITDTVGLASADTGSRAASNGPFGVPVKEEGARHHIHQYLRATVASDSDSTRVFPDDTVTLLEVYGRTRHLPAVMGRRIGMGRVLFLGDPDFLRNSILRGGDGAVLAVRLLEWVDPDHARPVVFDEYHHGHGNHADMMSVVTDALTGTAPGRAVLMAAAAALILLLSLSVRPIAPVNVKVIERRSPLEHVGALSRVYERIGATRLAARRLVRGLRRRHPLGATSALDDDGYLALIRERVAGTTNEVVLLRRAMREPLPAAEFVHAGAAIDHIERKLTS